MIANGVKINEDSRPDSGDAVWIIQTTSRLKVRRRLNYGDNVWISRQDEEPKKPYLDDGVWKIAKPFLKPYHGDEEDPKRGVSKRAPTTVVTSYDREEGLGSPWNVLECVRKCWKARKVMEALRSSRSLPKECRIIHST
nr:chromo domain-like [Tanacetum cinerariifolium]